MKSKVECPYCDGNAGLHHQVQEITYKKEAFEVKAHYYLCENCGQQFTTTATDELSMTQVFNLYRERHRIPFPDEIARIREGYGLSAAAISEVLGLGVNGYGLYEKGEIPSTAIGNLITSAENPWTFKNLLEGAIEQLPKLAYNRAIQKVEEIIESRKDAKPFFSQFEMHQHPNSFTGFRVPDLEKTRTMISTFIARCNAAYNDRLKINKMLFYADFMAYKMSGYSISGLSYRAIQYGPVPSCYDNIFALFENDMTIFSDWQLDKWNSPRELFFTHIKPQTEILTEFENGILNLVCEKFGENPSWDLVELSHNERGWKELNQQKELINYQEYAFDLSVVNL